MKFTIKFYIFELVYNHGHNILRLLMDEQIFVALQVKRSMVISNENFIELLPSAYPYSQNENFVSGSKNLLKNRN